jgi:hypothetical protein
MKKEGNGVAEFLCGMELLSKKGRDYIKSMIEIMLLYQNSELLSDKTLNGGSPKRTNKKPS